MISDLARRYDAPVFEPHVTIFVGANHPDAPAKAVSRAARECEPMTLNAQGLDHSDEFIKTLFVQFALTTQLRQLNETIRSSAESSSCYKLKPHLSLIYKAMPDAVRRDLANSIKLPFSTVAFDTLKAIRCISPTQTPDDVEAWSVVARKHLQM